MKTPDDPTKMSILSTSTAAGGATLEPKEHRSR